MISNNNKNRLKNSFLSSFAVAKSILQPYVLCHVIRTGMQKGKKIKIHFGILKIIL